MGARNRAGIGSARLHRLAEFNSFELIPGLLKGLKYRLRLTLGSDSGYVAPGAAVEHQLTSPPTARIMNTNGSRGTFTTQKNVIYCIRGLVLVLYNLNAWSRKMRQRKISKFSIMTYSTICKV
jgi:hypothetical protein